MSSLDFKRYLNEHKISKGDGNKPSITHTMLGGNHHIPGSYSIPLTELTVTRAILFCMFIYDVCTHT